MLDDLVAALHVALLVAFRHESPFLEQYGRRAVAQISQAPGAVAGDHRRFAEECLELGRKFREDRAGLDRVAGLRHVLDRIDAARGTGYVDPDVLGKERPGELYGLRRILGILRCEDAIVSRAVRKLGIDDAGAARSVRVAAKLESRFRASLKGGKSGDPPEISKH